MKDTGSNRWPDRQFVLALALGPLCWAGAGLAGLAHWPHLPVFQVDHWSDGVDWRQVIVVVLIAPLLEEVVFRGGIQHWLSRWPTLAGRAMGISLANVCTSVLFSATHLINQSPLTAVAVFVPSLVFGWVFDRYARILPCVVLHGFYNAGYLLFIA